MKLFRLLPILAIGALFCSLLTSQPPAKRKKVLAIGEVKGFQHDSVSHALATIEQMGQKSGLYDTYIRTDSQLLTKSPIGGNAKNLNYFDAVVFYTTGELDMSPQQKTDFMSFIKDDGKGFVGVHSAIDTFYSWPEYGKMTGGYFDQHPWMTFNAPIIVEDPEFPAMKGFPHTFVTHDEIYQAKDWSRDNVRVLARLDPDKIDLKNPRVHRTDKDFAVAWAKMYGKGRVFYSTFGHTNEAWDDKGVQTMYFEAIKWALGEGNPDITPRAIPTATTGSR